MNLHDFRRRLAVQHHLTPWQAADFAVLERSWSSCRTGQPPATQFAYLERARGHSKTTDLEIGRAHV